MSNFPNPIGVTGRATAGKDSVGRILVEGYGYVRVAFADALKSMALALDPIIASMDENELVRHPLEEKTAYVHPMYGRLSQLVTAQGWDQAKTHPEVRRFLQVLGTEGVREHIGENAWVDAAYKTMVKLGWEAGDEPEHLIVITDVRFPNEAAFVKTLGGQMWRVVRDVPKLDHPSENFVDTLPVDLELDNNGPESALPTIVAAALGGYLDDPNPYDYEQAEKSEADRW